MTITFLQTNEQMTSR